MKNSHKLATLKRALSHASMRRALSAYALATLAEYAAYFTVILIAFDRGGASAAGFAAAFQLAPSILVPAIIRVIAPRIANPMRWSLTWFVAMLVVGALIAGSGSLWVVVMVAGLRSIGYSLARPIHLAVVPIHSNSASDLTAGMVVTGWIDAGGAIGGPAIAALVLGISGASSVFVAAAVLAAVGAGASPTAGLIVGARRRSRQASVLALQGSKPLFAYKTVSAMLSGATDVIIVLVALELLGLREEGAGYLASLIGVGELIGSLFLVSLIGRRSLTRLLGFAALGRGATLSLLGAAPQAVPLIVIGGGFRPTHRVVQRLLLQRITPPDRYMQVFGVNEAFDIGGQAVGAALVPVLVALFGLQVSVVVAGAMLPLAFIALSAAFASIDDRSSLSGEVLAVLEDAEWLADLPSDIVEFVARTGTVESLAAGAALIGQGDSAAHCAWIVLEGTLEVRIGGDWVASLSRSDLVGEMALLHDQPRNADVIALDAVSVLRMDRSVFLDVIVGGRAGSDRIEAVASGRASTDESA